MLLKNCSLDITPMQHIMIEGPNGAGKSSLLRTIGGLWPLCGGKLTKPGGPKVLCYVPQVPYFFHGPLCDQVTYPDEPISMDSNPELVAKFDALVAAVGLSHIVAREGGWGTTKEWQVKTTHVHAHPRHHPECPCRKRCRGGVLLSHHDQDHPF